MKDFKLPLLTHLLLQLEFNATVFETQALGAGTQHVSPGARALVVELLDTAFSYAESNGFLEAAAAIFAAKASLSGHLGDSCSAASITLKHVRDQLLLECHRSKFVRVNYARSRFVDATALFGADVEDTFPMASQDIRDAGNCMAVECHTAAVFHLMRSAEWGLRWLATDVGLKKIAHRRKGTGRAARYVPLEFAEWEKILDQLQSVVDKRIEKMRRGPTKQREQEFYYGALQDIRGIRDAWRNHTMHTRRSYSAQDAEAIFEHVRRLLVALAARAHKDSTAAG